MNHQTDVRTVGRIDTQLAELHFSGPCPLVKVQNGTLFSLVFCCSSKKCSSSQMLCWNLLFSLLFSLRPQTQALFHQRSCAQHSLWLCSFFISFLFKENKSVPPHMVVFSSPAATTQNRKTDCAAVAETLGLWLSSKWIWGVNLKKRNYPVVCPAVL